jgi:hypothetical protein
MKTDMLSSIVKAIVLMMILLQISLGPVDHPSILLNRESLRSRTSSSLHGVTRRLHLSTTNIIYLNHSSKIITIQRSKFLKRLLIISKTKSH